MGHQPADHPLTCLPIIELIGTGQTFWLYAASKVAAFLFQHRRMPELTGRSLEQIEGRLSDEAVPARRLRRGPVVRGTHSLRP